jgi:hypothetical protein
MNITSFPNSKLPPRRGDGATAIDDLLALTNSRLFQVTGDPDVISTRLGLRHLKRLGLRALVHGMPAEVGAAGGTGCANDEPPAT